MSTTYRLRTFLAAASLCLSTSATIASSTVPVSLETRAQGADGIVVGSVERVTASYERNKYGDELIVSHAQLVVGEVLKGRDLAPGQRVTLNVEGGTVGDVTLRVSDLPAVVPGDRAVFFLERDPSGRLVPHLRGLGILKLDPANRVLGTSVSLGDVRSRVQGR